MDDLDLSILAFLQKDGRKRFTEIAKELDIAEGTVRNRVSRLVEEQVVQIVGLVDPHRMGYDAPAMIGVSIDPPHMEEATAQIATLPEVSYLIMVSGEFDLMVEVMCRNRDHLAAFIQEQLLKIIGVKNTKTFFILRTFKMAQGTQPILTEAYREI